ncbi:MAG TPA: hypothetical protein VIT45_07115 [Allosphingosinicella sp.]
MPLETTIALIGLFGVLAGSLLTYIATKRQTASQIAIAQKTAATDFAIAQEKLKTENQLAIASSKAIRELLEHPGWEMRSFDAIEKHMGGFHDDELRKLLVAAGAVRFVGKDGKEYWGLLERNAGKLQPPAKSESKEPWAPELGTEDPGSFGPSGPA